MFIAQGHRFTRVILQLLELFFLFKESFFFFYGDKSDGVVHSTRGEP